MNVREFIQEQLSEPASDKDLYYVLVDEAVIVEQDVPDHHRWYSLTDVVGLFHGRYIAFTTFHGNGDNWDIEDVASFTDEVNAAQFVEKKTRMEEVTYYE